MRSGAAGSRVTVCGGNRDSAAHPVEKAGVARSFLTSLESVDERARCLDAGADDLVPKPFAFAELAARIRAVLGRGSYATRPQLQVDDLVMDRLSHSAHRGGHAGELSPEEISLPQILMGHARPPGRPPTIVEQAWRLNVETMTNVVDVYVNCLRRKVDSGYQRPLIRTVRGTGYQIGTNGLAT